MDAPAIVNSPAGAEAVITHLPSLHGHQAKGGYLHANSVTGLFPAISAEDNPPAPGPCQAAGAVFNRTLSVTAASSTSTAPNGGRRSPRGRRTRGSRYPGGSQGDRARPRATAAAAEGGTVPSPSTPPRPGPRGGSMATRRRGTTGRGAAPPPTRRCHRAPRAGRSAQRSGSPAGHGSPGQLPPVPLPAPLTRAGLGVLQQRGAVLSLLGLHLAARRTAQRAQGHSAGRHR